MIVFRTVSGRRIDLASPTIDDVDVADIACGLSKLCRFTGQLRQFYSVAQHALLVSDLVDAPLQFAALHHDDSEAYLNDMSRNLKHSPHLAGYRRIEQQWTHVIEIALGLDTLTPAQRAHIKAADDLVAIFERSVLRNGYHWRPHDDIPDALAEGYVSGQVDHLLALARRCPVWWFQRPFFCLPPDAAEQLFLARHATSSKGLLV